MPKMPNATSGKTFQPSQVSMTPGSTPYLGSEAVRAQGSGPFDAAYRQNLATYGGSQLFKPGGLLAFNPTDPSTFPSIPSGGGSDPVRGGGVGLLDMALSGNPFVYNQSQQDTPAQEGADPSNADNSWQTWLNRFNKQGSLLRPSVL